MTDLHSVPVPKRMQHLPRDRRGYPIPSTILIDDQGRPHFTINDELKRQEQIRQHRCPICNGKLGKAFWFVGGPRSAFDEHGCYIDLPMHGDCMRYALQVCPYLAAPVYSGRLDGKTLGANAGKYGIMIDNTMIPNRPEVFVAVMTKGIKILRHGQYVKPRRPYLQIEYWAHGQRLPDAQGKAIVERILAMP